MEPATLLAFAATVANLLQGWDNGAIAGALLFLKPDLHLSTTMEGLLVAASLGGAWCSTLYSGAGADRFGRRKMLCISAVLFLISASVMAWTPNIYVLLLARLMLGAGIGLITTIVPMYIAEIAPPEIRGQLLTFPQFMGSMGQFFAYVVVFIMSLSKQPAWRYMLGMLFIPALLNLAFALFYLSESPRWLVSQGRMVEAKKVLQRLRNKTDVTAELALLVEGLNVGGETSLEEWHLKPADTMAEANLSMKHESFRQSCFKQSFKREGGVSWIATSVAEDYGAGGMSRRGSMAEAISSLKDPVVTLFGSMHSTQEHVPSGSIFGTFRGTHDQLPEAHPELFEDKHWDEEVRTPVAHANGYQSDDNAAGELDENLNTPLLNRPRSGKLDSPWSRAATPRGGMSRYGSATQSSVTHGSFNYYYGVRARGESRDGTPRESHVYTRQSSMAHSVAPVGSVPESIASVGIGGGWQLAWQWIGPEGQEGNLEKGHFKRVFLLQQGEQQQAVSTLSLPGVEPESIQAAALVGKPAQYPDEIADENPVGPAMVHPAETAANATLYSDLMEVGVRRALVVGVGIQILQQFSGINAVQSFIPQILKQSGASALITNLGVGANSASILASTFSSLVTLPCIFLSMKLMDRAGRRQLLLTTLPILLLSLITIAVSNLLLHAGLVQAVGSFGGVVIYICTFVMGFGAIPNILCSEIFPTRVRGVCIAICQTAMWSCNILVTNLFPTLLLAIGVGGIFSLFSVVVLVSWVFVYLKVPETKGMPLEVISEFFAMAATKAA